MRIISGTFKGRRISAPKKLPVRPTTDMSKESLFNILRNRYSLTRITVLDLFSGTGNISYEFASRGAEAVTSVDGNAGCAKFIQETANEFEMNVNVIKSDVYSYLARESNKYDIIFADPPYDFETDQFTKIVDYVMDNELLLPDGCLIIEHSKNTNLEDHPTFFEIRKYGGSAFSFFSK
ncbi:16S rRNA (guanine(966)-N(2))-methyltransferase RsmD [Leeuwenhoekiella sp. LLG6367-2.1]|uniref:16S rRNA (guanine(966)-N(2))-methyltransferase RsmD n=1 Tax=Leeuwenhoekiella sp. LLG6367-2.1 TaxID=3160833 RepID=UPI0038637D61